MEGKNKCFVVMKNLLPIAALMMLTLFSITACSDKVEIAAFNNAEEYLTKRDYRGAIRAYTQFVERYPDSSFAPEGQRKIGYIYGHYLDDMERARNAYAMLFYLYPGSPQIFLAREDMAGLYLSSGDFRKAIGEYVWLVENGAKEKRDTYRYSIAMGYIRLNDFRQARIEFEELLHDMPSTSMSPHVYFHIANTYYLEGNYASAINSYDETIRNYPEHPIRVSALLGKAAALEGVGRLKEALSILNELKPTHPNPDALTIRIESILERMREGEGVETKN